MSEHPMFTDTMASMLDLLKLSYRPHPPDIIISAAPQVWLNGSLPDDTQLFDISAFVGPSSWAAGNSPQLQSSLEEYVVEQLLSLGWPREKIRFQYRAAGSQDFRLDLALLDQRGDLLAGIEVKNGTNLLDAQSIGRLYAGVADSVPRLYVTDGRGCLEIDRSRPPIVSRLPTPQDLGLAISATSLSDRIIRVAHLGWLDAAVRQERFKSAILDFTIPWGMRIEPESPFRALLPAAENVPGRIDLMAILLSWLSSLPQIQTLATITPPSVASIESFQWLRHCLVERMGVAAHIELPAGALRPLAASLRSSYLLLGRHRDEVYFDSLASPGDLVAAKEQPWYKSYAAWLSGHAPDRGFQRSAAALQSWTIVHNDPQAEAARGRVALLGPNHSLGELCDIFVSHILGSAIVSELPDDPIRIIDARRLRDPLADDDDKFVSPTSVVQERDFLRPGDILLPRIASGAARAVEYAGDGRAVAGGSVVVIRPVAEVDSKYLAEYLNSNTGQRLLQAASSGTGIPQISVASLKRLPIPLIEVDFGRSVGEIDSAHSTLVSLTNALNAGRASLFDCERQDDFLDQLEELKRKSVLMTQTLQLTDSLEFQISQFFPFPLAYGYRLLRGYVDVRQKVQEQLRVAENILAFLASASMALLDDQDRRTISKDLRGYWKKGLSPGDWKEIIRQSSERFKDYSDHPLAASIAKLNIAAEKKGFGKDALFLINSKNDFKHDRGPKTEQDFVKLSEQLEESLHSTMKHLLFWTKYPIRQVRQCDVMRRPGQFDVRCLRVVGDHPGFGQENVVWHEALKRKDLYLEISERRWLPLFPFLQSHDCARCKAEELYSLTDGMVAAEPQ